MRTLVAYVPVLHEGYRRFFTAHDGPKELLLFGREVADEFPQLAKDIRQLDPALMQRAIEALGLFERVSLLTPERAQELDAASAEIILPDEDVSRELAARYFSGAHVRFEPIFLRWDKHNAAKEKPVVPENRITRKEFHRAVMRQATEEAGKSSDFWRHVGAVLVKDGNVLSMGYNAHVPSAHSPYANGDPRNNFRRGDHIELSTALHAEAALIAEAARRGLPLAGADLYVTVFPCPPCAKLVAYAGIQNLYCGGGYAVLDGEEVLKSKGVNIFFVE